MLKQKVGVSRADVNSTFITQQRHIRKQFLLSSLSPDSVAVGAAIESSTAGGNTVCSGNGGWEREGVAGGDGDGVGGRVLVSGAGGRGVGWGEADTGSVGAWLVGHRLSVVYTQRYMFQ